jgi:hypothetical protein
LQLEFPHEVEVGFVGMPDEPLIEVASNRGDPDFGRWRKQRILRSERCVNKSLYSLARCWCVYREQCHLVFHHLRAGLWTLIKATSAANPLAPTFPGPGAAAATRNDA